MLGLSASITADDVCIRCVSVHGLACSLFWPRHFFWGIVHEIDTFICVRDRQQPDRQDLTVRSCCVAAGALLGVLLLLTRMQPTLISLVPRRKCECIYFSRTREHCFAIAHCSMSCTTPMRCGQNILNDDACRSTGRRMNVIAALISHFTVPHHIYFCSTTLSEYVSQ